MKPIFSVRVMFSFDPNSHSDASGLDTGTDSPVQQQFADEFTPALWMERCARTGIYTVVPPESLRYGDFTEAPTTLQAAYEISRSVDSAVSRLMSEIPQVDLERIHSRDDLLSYLTGRINSSGSVPPAGASSESTQETQNSTSQP